jgi:protein gp37
MAIKTAIQWCDSTCNPAVGCAGCELHPEHCYAKAWCDRWAGRAGYPKRFESPELFPGRIEEALTWPDLRGKDRPDKPWLNGMPRVIFLCDIGDPFTPGLPDDWLAPHVLEMAQRHIWILLSKWPGRMGAFVEWWRSQYCERFGSRSFRRLWPRNIWLGTSVTSEKNLGRIAELRTIPAAVRLVSMEPLLGFVNLRSAVIVPQFSPLVADPVGDLGFDWLILGGESGRGARPCKDEWIRSPVVECAAASVPCFVKQFGSNAYRAHPGTDASGPVDLVYDEEMELGDSKGGDWDEWPEDLRVREMPDWRSIL